MAADGNCLYSAVGDQIKRAALSGPHSIVELRRVSNPSYACTVPFFSGAHRGLRYVCRCVCRVSCVVRRVCACVVCVSFQLAADYILDHPDDFLPFLIAGEELPPGGLKKYCDEVPAATSS